MAKEAPVGLTVAEIPWEAADHDGTRSATLVGSRQDGQPFTYAFYLPAGFWDRPHSHLAAAHLVVASGELRLGYGTLSERDRAARYPAGSFLFVPAGAVHFDGAEQDTVLIGTAVGPWSTDYWVPDGSAGGEVGATNRVENPLS